MGDFIYFTEEQKERANAVQIADILRREHEEVERSGNEWRWKRHRSVTFRGSSWYRHSRQVGSHAIDFMQEFFGMSYPEAVSYLLDGEQGQLIERGKGQETKRKPGRAEKGRQSVEKEQTEERKEPKEPKELKLPEKNPTMKRVYAYLLQKRHIDREILSYFAKAETIYESAEHHNIVFAGLDSEGKIRHIHVKGSCSDGRSFRLNQEGSEAAYGFGYRGTGNRLYVFEAPIDLLSFLSLYPENWQGNSYITLNGVAEHAMLQALKDNPRLDTVVLCLDHDPAGIEACGRLAEILVRNGYGAVKRLQSACKDWNEDFKTVMDIQRKWRRIHYWESAYEDSLMEEFEQFVDGFFGKRNAEYKAHEDVKKALIERARKAAVSEDWDKASEDMKVLMDEWKACPSAGREKDDVLWEEFNSERQKFFDRKHAHWEDMQAKFEASQKRKTGINRKKQLL